MVAYVIRSTHLLSEDSEFEVPMKILVASSNPHKIEEIRDIFDEMARQANHRQTAAAPSGTHEGEELPVPPIELVSLSDLPFEIPEPVEDQPTFEGNAVKKARHYATAARMLCLADDSGLEVDALHGEPGVYSARYSGIHGERSVVDPANNRKLLDSLGDMPASQRNARFVCAMALVIHDPTMSIVDAAQGAPVDRKKDKAATQIHRSMHIDDLALADEVLALARGTIEGRILLPEEAEDIERPWLGRGAYGFGYDPIFYVPEHGCTTAELAPAAKNALSHRGNASRTMWRTIRHLYKKAAAGRDKKKLPWQS